MSDLQTPRPMDERRKTYLRLIAEICNAIVSVAAVALLGVPVVPMAAGRAEHALRRREGEAES